MSAEYEKLKKDLQASAARHQASKLAAATTNVHTHPTNLASVAMAERQQALEVLDNLGLQVHAFQDKGNYGLYSSAAASVGAGQPKAKVPSAPPGPASELANQLLASPGNGAEPTSSMEDEEDKEDGPLAKKAKTTDKRREQNRIASARFRAKNKLSRELAEASRKKISMLEEKVKLLETHLKLSSSKAASDIAKVQENTLKWVLSKFWLRQKYSFKTVAWAVHGLLSVYKKHKRPTPHPALAAI